MSETPQIRIRGLYKIFGPDAKGMLEHVRAGVTKTGLLAEYRHVLGLQDINVEMQRGQTTVVMGLSGSGKSTLIRHINRLIDPTAGEILVDGEDIMRPGQKGLRQMRQTQMSMVFQNFALLPHRTVLENAGDGAGHPRRGRSGAEAGTAEVAGPCRAGRLREELSAPAFRRNAAARRHRAGSPRTRTSC